MPRPAYRLVRRAATPVAPLRDDPLQRHVVEHTDGPLLVVGGPGTGKTTVLVEAVAARIAEGIDPERILVLTFGRRGAGALRDRIEARISGPTFHEPLVRTFHAYAFGLLRRAAAERGEPSPRLLTGPEQDLIIRELLEVVGDPDAEDTVRWPESLRPALPTRAFAQQLRDLMQRAAERGIGPVELARLGERLGRDDWPAAARFLREYVAVLALRDATTRGSTAYDPAELVRAASGLLTDDPALLEAERRRLAYVYVDELADTDPAQIELLSLVAGGGTPLVAFGDPDSSVYGFRGADPQAVSAFPQRFRTASGALAEVITLHTSYRAEPALLTATGRLSRRMRGATRHRHLHPPATPPAPGSRPTSPGAPAGQATSGREAASAAGPPSRVVSGNKPASADQLASSGDPEASDLSGKETAASGGSAVSDFSGEETAASGGSAVSDFSGEETAASGGSAVSDVSGDQAGPLGSPGVPGVSVGGTVASGGLAASGASGDETGVLAGQAGPGSATDSSDASGRRAVAGPGDAAGQSAAEGSVADAGGAASSGGRPAGGRSGAEEGVVAGAVVRTFRSPTSETAFVAHALREAHLLHGVPWSRMAVVLRSTTLQLPSMQRALAASGVPTVTHAEDLPLHLQPAVAPFLLLLRCALEPDVLDEEASVALLHSPLGGADPLAERRLRQGLRALALAAGDRRPSGELLVDALRDPAGLDVVERRWAVPAQTVARLIATAREVAARPGATAEQVLWSVWRASGLADRWYALSTRGAPVEPGGEGGRARQWRAEAADRDLDAMVVLFDAAARFVDRLPGARTEVFLDHVLGQDLPADSIAPSADRGEAVRLLTAHAAKGLEWDVVVLAGVQEGIWPDLRLRGSLLGSERLVDFLAGRAASGAAAVVGQTSALLDEERRLFYVAATRARQRLIVTAVASASVGGSDGEEQPSRFLTELGLPDSRPGPEAPPGPGPTDPDDPGPVEPDPDPWDQPPPTPGAGAESNADAVPDAASDAAVGAAPDAASGAMASTKPGAELTDTSGAELAAVTGTNPSTVAGAELAAVPGAEPSGAPGAELAAMAGAEAEADSAELAGSQLFFDVEAADWAEVGAAEGQGHRHESSGGVTVPRQENGRVDAAPVDVAEDEQELVVGRPPRALTLSALVAELRTAVVAPDATPARRHAAAAELARLAAAGVPGAHPDEWWGLRQLSDDRPLVEEGEPVKVTPSSMESALRCSLRWLLERHGGAAPAGPAQGVGNLVHAAAMLAEDANADRERLVEYVSARFDAIELAARWLAGPEQERAQGMVDKLLRWLAKNPRRLLAIEHEFTVRLDDPARPIQLTGRVDRLEVDEQGRLVVIDLKTGKTTTVSASDVEEHAQLAGYQAAVDAGAFQEFGEESGGAALVQLGPTKEAREQMQLPLAEATDPNWAYAMVRRTADTMAAATFSAVANSKCRVCPVRTSCPISGQGRQVVEP
nr:UvrD-helicase domain-containing protein [Actinoplanes friuliensis]